MIIGVHRSRPLRLFNGQLRGNCRVSTAEDIACARASHADLIWTLHAKREHFALNPPAPPRPGALEPELRTLIAQEGPMTVARYMALALGHPLHGYYMTRDPFGAAGDFTTAPEISQMFGELLGLWAGTVWIELGQPDPVRLVELGPGRGTLMADALRAVRALPAFRQALDLHLVETSAVLRAAQERSLAGQGARATWHADLATVPDGPVLVLANEFFDALPIRQFERTDRGWCERLVGIDRGRLAFGLAEAPTPGLPATGAFGAVLEVQEHGQELMKCLCRRLIEQGGAVLVIDYGSVSSGFGDTLQAVKAHRFVDPLMEPGEVDLTAHVDFAALARVARSEDLVVHGPLPQGQFLRRLGIEERAAALTARATRDQGATIAAALARLTGPDPGMGDLFKVLAVTCSDAPAPPGFASEM